jgi:hypothetical protein
MATATLAAQPDRMSLLRRALQTDAIVSALFAATFLAASGPLGDLLGIPAAALLALGAIFLPYAALIWYQASRPTISRRFAWAIILLNVDWVILSAALLIGGFLPLTQIGWWGVLITGDIVAALAVAQYLGLRRQRA